MPPANYAGQSGPDRRVRQLQHRAEVAGQRLRSPYNQGPFTGTIQARYVGPGRYLVTGSAAGRRSIPSDPGYDTTDPNSINDNTVDDAIYINLAASFDITDEVQVFGALNNVFDKDPVVAPGGNGFPTNPVYFDTYGRTFRVGARVKF